MDRRSYRWKTYGVDVLIPNKMVDQSEKFDAEKLKGMIPQEYADFRADLLKNRYRGKRAQNN